MEPGIAFALGFLGSLHCAAMCGPLMLALPTGSREPTGFVAGRVLYQLGRIVTYCLLGIFAGLIGKSIFLLGVQRWVSILLGVTILIGFFASNRFLAYAFITRLVCGLRSAMSAQMQRNGLMALVAIGMLNGLLPCGLVYVALAGAVSQGTVLAGIIYMAMFGLGTLPTMLGISLSGKLFPLSLRQHLRRAIPIGVCAVAALLILRGMALGIPYVSPNPAPGGFTCCSPH